MGKEQRSANHRNQYRRGGSDQHRAAKKAKKHLVRIIASFTDNVWKPAPHRGAEAFSLRRAKLKLYVRWGRASMNGGRFGWGLRGRARRYALQSLSDWPGASTKTSQRRTPRA